MPWSRPTWSAPRTWFLTVRLIESALVLLTVGMVLIAYAGWRSARDTGPSGQMGPDGRPLDLNLADTIAMSGSYNPGGKPPVWAVSLSLAATDEIAFAFFSSAY